MIYVDSSVALAHLLTEERRPGEEFWRRKLTSSRLLAYEVWNRLHARGLEDARLAEARGLLARVTLIELTVPVLARALEPYPVSVRTLDGLHLATLAFLIAGGARIELASYDQRLQAGARALHIPLAPA